MCKELENKTLRGRQAGNLMNDKRSNHTVIMSRCRIPELVAMGAHSNHRILDIRKNRPPRTINKRTIQKNRKR